MKLSAFVITFNEAHNIERCLKSLSFADEIVVVDSGSSDDTVALAKKFTPNVHHHPWAGFSGQRNYAMDLCSNDWVFFLDADEEATPECVADITRVMREGTDKTWFSVRRREYQGGKLLRYGACNPSYQIRLFRKSCGRFEGEVHEYARMTGEEGVIEGPMEHYGIGDDTGELWRKFGHYARISAREKFAAGERRPFYYKYFSGLAMFLKCYFPKRGLLDGLPGFYRAVGDGYYFYERQAELQRLWRTAENKDPKKTD
jgi:glycosyltransferase involved in cell wall biosynthesis